MTPQAKPKATMVSKYNAAVSTLVAALMFKILIIVNGLSIENAALKEQIISQSERTSNLTSMINVVRMDVSGLSGTVNAQGNRTSILETKVDAILPNKNQFKVKN